MVTLEPSYKEKNFFFGHFSLMQQLKVLSSLFKQLTFLMIGWHMVI